MLETIKNIRAIVIRNIMKRCVDDSITVNTALMQITAITEESKEVSAAIMKYHEACLKYVDASTLKEEMP